jgi:hypothetical protein
MGVYSSLKSTKPDWIRDHKVNILVRSALPDPALPDVPLVMDYAKTEARNRRSNSFWHRSRWGGL